MRIALPLAQVRHATGVGRWRPAGGTPLIAWALAAAIGASPSARAADAAPAVPPAGAVPTFEQLRPNLAPPAPSSDAVPDLPPPRELGKPLDDITVDVTGYTVDASAPAELRAALAELTAPYTGPRRSFEDLMGAVAAVGRYLQRDMGLYLGYAYLPEQRLEDGQVRIAVLEGRLDEVLLRWRDDIPVDRAVVEAHLAQLKPGDVLRVIDVERVVFLLNDLRGLTARFEVRQGRKPGTATLVVSPQPDQRVGGKIELDANGSRFSGLYRMGATAYVASPLGRGDGVVLSAQTTDTQGLSFLLGGYTLPIGSQGLKAGVSMSRVDYRLNEEVPLGLTGRATAASIYALHPVVRSRNLNLFLQVSQEVREFLDRKADLGSVADATKRTRETRLGMAGDFRDNALLGGVSTYELAAVFSRVDYLRNGPSAAMRDPRQRTRVTFGFSRLNNLISNRMLLFFSLQGQKARSNLDTTEQFGIGGPTRVRSYAPGEGTGDEGLVTSVELRLLPPESWLGRHARETVLMAFYDWGRVRYKHDPSAQVNGFVNRGTFSGYGMGAIWERPRTLTARLTLGWPVQGEVQNDTVKRSPRLYATLTHPF